MYNPLQILDRKLLRAMTRTPKYFVREYYPRGAEKIPGTTPLLLTHYGQDDIDRERANRHFKIIAKDPYRFLYDTKNPEHLRRLSIAAGQPAGFKIYVNLVPVNWESPRHLRNNIYAFMRHKFPAWKNGGKLQVNLQDLFGQLYLVLSWQGNRVEVLLEEVEKFRV